MFWNEIESSRIFRVSAPFCFEYCSGVLFGSDDRSAQQIQRVVAFKFVVLTLGAYHWTVRYDVTARYQGGPVQHACEARGLSFPLNKRIQTFLREYRITSVLGRFHVDLIRVLLALANKYQISFATADGLGWFPNFFDNSVVVRVPYTTV